MTNDKLLTELRQRLIKLSRPQTEKGTAKAEARKLLDLIEEEWTDCGPEPCGLQEREHADDITGEEYSMLIVWEYCIEETAPHHYQKLLDKTADIENKKTLHFAHLFEHERSQVGSYEMRRWAGLVGRELERAYDKAVAEGCGIAGEYCVAFDFDWIPAVLEDYAQAHNELISPQEAFQYGKAHYKQYMERAQAEDEKRRAIV